MVAVCSPTRYDQIFTKRVTKTVIVVTWLGVVAFMSLYFLIPCSMLGYSPQYYEFVFVRCSPDIDRDYSIFGTIVNRSCFLVCFFSLGMDIVTFSKIIQIKLMDKTKSQNKAFMRNTAVQNILMLSTLGIIVFVNNRTSSGQTLSFILAFDSTIVTHVSNGLALILFNPEVRRFLQKRIKDDIEASITAARSRN
uniref:7TM_GPCR_Srx domain-containing protein n=1 Tax=Steinernema glaseri TaxID=37863 RepID=A0A1I7Z1P6_9BILA